MPSIGSFLDLWFIVDRHCAVNPSAGRTRTEVRRFLVSLLSDSFGVNKAQSFRTILRFSAHITFCSNSTPHPQPGYLKPGPLYLCLGFFHPSIQRDSLNHKLFQQKYRSPSRLHNKTNHHSSSKSSTVPTCIFFVFPCPYSCLSLHHLSSPRNFFLVQSRLPGTALAKLFWGQLANTGSA